MLLPDTNVRSVVGKTLQHETLIAIAQNKNIVVRTAVVGVSDIEIPMCMYIVRIHKYLMKSMNE